MEAGAVSRCCFSERRDGGNSTSADNIITGESGKVQGWSGRETEGKEKHFPSSSEVKDGAEQRWLLLLLAAKSSGWWTLCRSHPSLHSDFDQGQQAAQASAAQAQVEVQSVPATPPPKSASPFTGIKFLQLANLDALHTDFKNSCSTLKCIFFLLHANFGGNLFFLKTMSLLIFYEIEVWVSKKCIYHEDIFLNC